MTTQKSFPRRSAVVRTLYQLPESKMLLRAAATPFPEELARWLAQLALLEAVPFNAIVADARMLPQESVRFFYIDQNWLDALLDGALSIAAAFDAHHTATVDLLREHIHQETKRASLSERAKRRLARRKNNTGRFPVKTPVVELTANPELWTGFLLRSAVVADWPGLNVRAFRDQAGKEPIELLRVDRVAPTVLFAVFKGIGKRFDIAVPPQGLRFGAENGPADELRTPVRGLGGAIPSGQQVDELYAEVHLRENAGDRRVLDVSKTRTELESKLKEAYGLNPVPPLDPGSFAIEMVAGSQNQRFFNELSNSERDDDA
jgi:hypothetical protein